jgi:hypothetical protein
VEDMLDYMGYLNDLMEVQFPALADQVAMIWLRTFLIHCVLAPFAPPQPEKEPVRSLATDSPVSLLSLSNTASASPIPPQTTPVTARAIVSETTTETGPLLRRLSNDQSVVRPPSERRGSGSFTLPDPITKSPILDAKRLYRTDTITWPHPILHPISSLYIICLILTHISNAKLLNAVVHLLLGKDPITYNDLSKLFSNDTTTTSALGIDLSGQQNTAATTSTSDIPTIDTSVPTTTAEPTASSSLPHYRRHLLAFIDTTPEQRNMALKPAGYAQDTCARLVLMMLDRVVCLSGQLDPDVCVGAGVSTRSVLRRQKLWRALTKVSSNDPMDERADTVHEGRGKGAEAIPIPISRSKSISNNYKLRWPFSE